MALLPSSAIPSASGGGYTIDQSLRFNDDDSAYLSRTPSSGGNKRTWTWSGWVKRSNITLGTDLQLFSTNQQAGATGWFSLFFTGADKISFCYYDGTYYQNVTDAVYRDNSSWYHVVFVFDTTQSTSTDRYKLYINGSLVTSYASSNYPPQNTDGTVNNNQIHYISKAGTVGTQYFDGLMAEVHLIDGTALTPSSFAETGTYGEWKPKAYDTADGAYGTNGFYLDFSNTGTKHAITAGGDAQHSTAQSKIGSSSIAFDGTGDYLTSVSTDYSFGTDPFTIEAWVYQASFGSDLHIYSGDSVNGETRTIFLNVNSSGNVVAKVHDYGNGTPTNLTSSSTLSTSTWQHIALVRTASDAWGIYIDGTSEATSSAVADVQAPSNGGRISIGSRIEGGSHSNYFNGYIDELRISNTARYTTTFTPSTTAFTDDSNTLLLIQSDTSDGSTTFTDSSGVEGSLGNDQSGEDNHFTLNNLTASDQVLDSPSNTFATWNPLHSKSNIVFEEGNLSAEIYHTGESIATSTINPSSGKWYFECVPVATNNNSQMCIGLSRTINYELGRGPGSSGDNSWNMYSDVGQIYYEGSTGLSLGSYDVDDIIQVAYNMDSGKVWWGKNGTWLGSTAGDPAAGTNSHHGTLSGSVGPACGTGHSGHTFILNAGQDSSFAGNKTAQSKQDSNGIGDFYYEPPDGFLALCSFNLPDVAVTPSEHFNTVLYSGNGTTQSITGVNFQPDFTWIKQRSGTRSHGFLDSIRGGGEVLFSNNDAAEASTTNTITSFDSDGFSLGNQTMTNESGTYVAWNWKAGTSVSGDTAGSGTAKTYTGSVNADAGFSIIAYEGNGTAGHTVSHHLNSAPEMLIVKSRTVDNKHWATYHIDLGNTVRLDLERNVAKITGTGAWNSTTPTSSLVTFGTTSDVNTDAADHIMYAFHSVEGFSRCGKYEGNNDADGAFVYTGFRPAWIMVKASSTGGTHYDWAIYDTARSSYNAVGHILEANQDQAEVTGTGRGLPIDIVSNGFKFRSSYAESNAAQTYIYLAFAEQPFKHSNAR